MHLLYNIWWLSVPPQDPLFLLKKSRSSVDMPQGSFKCVGSPL